MDGKFCSKSMCLGKLLTLILLTLPHAPWCTKASNFEEGVGILKLQRSVVVSAVTLTEYLV